jgi:type IV pilus assembly protein PilM
VSAFASLFGKETLVGLDIGSAYLKVVQVEAQKQGFRVTRAAQHKTPEGAVRDGIVVDKQAVGEAVRQMLRAAGVSATGAAIAVSGPTVVVRQIKLPRMTEAALRKSVRYEAGKYISANVDESAVEFEILGPCEGGGAGDEDQMNVMLVAAPREMVESRIAAVEIAGLEAAAVDMEPFALQRALADCNAGGPFRDNGMRALVDLGASHTEVSLLSGTTFALTRSIPIAGDTLTNVLKNHFRCDPREAEQRKAGSDMALLLEAGAGSEELEAPRLLQPVLDELLREVRRSIQFYQSQLPEGAEPQPLKEILLCGGGAQLPGLALYMKARLGTETRLGNAFDNPYFETHAAADAFLDEQHPCLAVALGLAVKEYLPPSPPAVAPATAAAAALAHA